MHLAAGEHGSEIFACRSAAFLPAHRPAQHDRACAAVHHHDVNDLVVLFGETISVAIQQPEAVVTLIGERFARGMVRGDVFHKRGFVLPYCGRCPQSEARFLGRE